MKTIYTELCDPRNPSMRFVLAEGRTVRVWGKCDQPLVVSRHPREPRGDLFLRRRALNTIAAQRMIAHEGFRRLAMSA